MSLSYDYLQAAAARVEADALRTDRRADRTQLLEIAEACRELARQLAEPPPGRPAQRAGPRRPAEPRAFSRT